ncbi:MAG: oxidoreductase [Firmicutes bacterium HGW-Firmicutes-7]|nr:MAG: oxidoreductase [Firmicutes bacterium HGW-Firmicutes-7]
MKKAIVIGASSGIGRELAIRLSKGGYLVGVTGRRVELLEEIKEMFPQQILVKKMDVTNTEEAMKNFEDLIGDLGGLDLIIINAGFGHINKELNWEPEKHTIEVNALGFTAMVNVAYRYFREEKKGCIVGISSIAGIRGSSYAPAYSASKAFISNYLEGVRCLSKKEKSHIKIIDVKPGFVDTAMARGDKVFWMAPVEKAAKQILVAIEKGREKVIVTKRWAIIMRLMKILPEWIYSKL